jgi:hypothetical protein
MKKGSDLHGLLPKIFFSRPAPYALRLTPYSLRPAPYALRHAPCSLLPAPCSLRPTPESVGFLYTPFSILYRNTSFLQHNYLIKILDKGKISQLCLLALRVCLNSLFLLQYFLIHHPQLGKMLSGFFTNRCSLQLVQIICIL